MVNDQQKPLKIVYHHRIASKDGQYVHVEEIVNALTKLGHTIAIRVYDHVRSLVRSY